MSEINITSDGVSIVDEEASAEELAAIAVRVWAATRPVTPDLPKMGPLAYGFAGEIAPRYVGGEGYGWDGSAS